MNIACPLGIFRPYTSMSTTFKKRWVVLAMDPLLLCACKRNRPPLAKPEDAMTGALKVNPGKPLGAMATMTIGPAGGTLAFPHTGVKLTIPAGALKANVHFSIQQLKPTITGRLASGTYRLLPADVRFKKDLKITLPYFSDRELAAGRLLPRGRALYRWNCCGAREQRQAVYRNKQWRAQAEITITGRLLLGLSAC